MKKFFVSMVAALLTFAISFGIIALIGLVVWRVYNVIAWNFNLAPLNYWTCTGAWFVLATIFKTCKKIKKED